MKSVMEKCWKEDPGKRPEMNEVMLILVTKEFMSPGCEMNLLLEDATGIEGGV
jgi:hypothetical protein